MTGTTTKPPREAASTRCRECALTPGKRVMQCQQRDGHRDGHVAGTAIDGPYVIWEWQTGGHPVRFKPKPDPVRGY